MCQEKMIPNQHYLSVSDTVQTEFIRNFNNDVPWNGPVTVQHQASNPDLQSALRDLSELNWKTIIKINMVSTVPYVYTLCYYAAFL